MKVISRPHGCGRFTISRSSNTLVICSCMISMQEEQLVALYVMSYQHPTKLEMILCEKVDTCFASANRYNSTHEK